LKIIIAGDRTITSFDTRVLQDAVFAFLEPEDARAIEIVSGGARGADAVGEAFSRLVLGREPKVFPADWAKHGKAAGPMRNEQMARYADGAVILQRDRPSPGSSNMAMWMLLLGKPVRVLTTGRV